MSLGTDLRYGLRQLTKSPSFTIVAVVALALGIGANTALFSIIDAIFLEPLPFPCVRELVHLTSSLPDRNLNAVPFSYPRYEVIHDHQQVFSDTAVGTFAGFTVTGNGDPEQVGGFLASANFLTLLGVQPALGRNFSAEEDRPGGPAVALISDTYWKQRFNRDPSVLNRSITLDGQRRTIVGVLPPALSRFPFNQTQIWTPRPFETPGFVPAQRDNGAFGFEVIGRLKPGVTLAQAREHVKLLAADYARAHPKNVDAPSEARVNPLLDDFIGDQRRTYAILCGAVGCVLLIACANVANLLLARFTGRRKEISLRFALGASRGQVVRQLLIESLLIAGTGAAVGLLLAYWGLSAFVKLGADFIPRSSEVAIQPIALGFTVVVAVLTGLGMGLLPAIHAAKQDANDALKDSARGSSGGAGQSRLRGALLVSEIALSLVLLIGATLLLSSFARLQRVSLGFQPERIFVGFLNVPPGKHPSKAALAGFYRQLVERVSTIPGVESAALNDAPPMAGINAQSPVAAVGRPIPPLSQRQLAIRHIVTPGSFHTLGMTLKAGRDFSERDNPNSPQTVIINETLARRFFPNEDPIGQKLVTGMAQITAEIVGVVSDTQTVNLNQPPQPEYFVPTLQRPENFTSLLVRTNVEPSSIAGAVRAAMRDVDPDLPLNNPQTMNALLARTLADRRLAMVLLGSFAGLALLLASIGVYSVMAYIVTQRTGEIGIRLALGASPARIQAMVLRQGMTFVAGGIVIGLVAAYAATRVMANLLYDVRADDPLIYGGITVFIGGVAAAACYLPARRVTAIDPLGALRTQ